MHGVRVDRRARVRARAARPTSPTAGSRPRSTSRCALEKPLLLEGEAGVGKTEAAKALAAALGAPLIRLQCYEGLDVAHAVYEWNYARQLLHIRAAQEGTVDEAELFGPEFLIRRPLLEAIESEEPVVLLIDEIDRADEEFEAFLLEVLSDFQVTIPELGTIHARSAAVRDPHLEPHARAARRAQAPLPLPLDRPPVARARDRDRRAARARACPDRLAEQAARVRRRAARRSTCRSRRASPRRSTGSQALTALGQQELDVEHVAGDARRRCSSTTRTCSRSATRRSRASSRPRVAEPPEHAVVRHVVVFGRVLREGGLEVGPGRIADALRGLDARRPRAPGRRLLDAARRRSSRAREDLETFDRAFDAWFLRAPAPAAAAATPTPRAGTAQRRKGGVARPGPEIDGGEPRSARGAATSCCARATSRR